MSPFFRGGALAAAVAGLAAPVVAQPDSTLPEITVTGNPLGGAGIGAPAAALSGTALLLRTQPSLGETLGQLPGVSSTYFGPAASRPVIRGQDGDRIRILSNSGATLDASGLSFDHAVPVDPIAVERIEVLRGPAALLHGGSAAGGVVNLIDNRIPREPLAGVTGRADLGLASGNRERSASALVEGGNERIGLHADVFRRAAGQVKVPVALACAPGGVPSLARRICNSASEAEGGAVGASLFFDSGHLGASLSGYRSHYGSPAEDEVTIGMHSRRAALEGQWRIAAGPVQSLRLAASHTDYRHTEFDAGVPGTVFGNRGGDLRIELRQRRWGALDGVVGYQADAARFSADGDEAFAPHSRTRQRALFTHQELDLGWGRLTAGARVESVRVTSLGNPEVDRFVAGTRRFSPSSQALGLQWNIAPAWQVHAQVARSRRAPRDYELFANGPHLATGAWERGDAGLAAERSTHAEAGLQWKSGRHQARVHAFVTRFRNYTALQASGEVIEDLPAYAWRQVPARFHGIESSATFRLLDAQGSLDLDLRGDLVRAVDLSSRQPLPRIAPVRVGATLAWNQGPWGARIGFDHAARQGRVPAADLPTASYTLWNAALTWRLQAAQAQWLWYARLDNLGDQMAYSAGSILTQTAPGRVPLPGRSLRVGLRADF
jgi:iron complex outermembrane receptor protein